jgi:hypothetical protein
LLELAPDARGTRKSAFDAPALADVERSMS